MSTSESDTGDDAALPMVRVDHERRPRLSLVWLVPLLALVIGAALLVRSVLQSGPGIEIEFRTAEGLEAGKTEVRYKEVVIGRVQSVRLTDARQRVVAVVKLDRSAAGVAVEDTRFWVVRPRVGVGGISGIGTLLSGAYIGVDAGESEQDRAEFVGLESPPDVLRSEPGAVFVLRAGDLGSLDIGSPIYYHRTPVGRVIGYTLDAGADALSVKIFIEAPYLPLVTPDTLFWNASGVDLSIDANGLNLSTQTVASVIAGGVAFDQPPGSLRGKPAAASTTFTLFADRRAAMAPPLGRPLAVRMVFDGSLRGLAPGAPIDLLGVEIGKVRALSLQYDAQQRKVPVQVLADIFPLRLGAVRGALAGPTPDAPGADAALLKRLVERGLRAQLRTGNLLTGQLFVAMDFYPKAAALPATLHDGVLTLPTVPGTLGELQAQLAEVMSKLSKLPIEDIGRGLADTLRQADATLKDLTPEARQALVETRRTLQSTQTLLGQVGPDAQASLAELRQAMAAARGAIERLDRNLLDEGAPMQHKLDLSLEELQRALQSLRLLGDQLQRHPESLLRGKPDDPPLPDTGKPP
jgi:paraquat-inducible protein B